VREGFARWLENLVPLAVARLSTLRHRCARINDPVGRAYGTMGRVSRRAEHVSRSNRSGG
jgi:hypothetical protein